MDGAKIDFSINQKKKKVSYAATAILLSLLFKSLTRGEHELQ